MHYGNIKPFDIANGEGVRVSLFVSGCTNHCKGCFQPETWDFDYGMLFDESAQDEIIEKLKPEFIQGLTVLGGEPFEFENQKALLPFLKRIKQIYPKKDIWVYTGFVLEDLLENGKRSSKESLPMLELIDVLVDGPFVEDLKNISLPFRGSTNQRVLDLKASLAQKKPVPFRLKSIKTRVERIN